MFYSSPLLSSPTRYRFTSASLISSVDSRSRRIVMMPVSGEKLSFFIHGCLNTSSIEMRFCGSRHRMRFSKSVQ